MKKLQELRNRKTNNKGFSLVELIIVIAIMAVLIAILAPQFIKYVEKSRKNADLDTIDEARTALETAYSDLGAEGTWSGDATVSLTNSGTTVTAATDVKDELENKLGIGDSKLKSSNWADGGVQVKIDSVGKITYMDGDGTVVTDAAAAYTGSN